MVAHQHLGGWKDELAPGLEVGFALVLVEPGQVGHVAHQRHVRVVGQHLGHGGHRLRAAEETGLPGRDGDILEHRARLLDDDLVVDGRVVEDFGRVTHHDAGDDRQWMRAHGGDGGDIACDPAGAARIAGVETHDAGRRSVLLAGFEIGGIRL